MFKRIGGECGSGATEGESGRRPSSLGTAGETAVTGGKPGEGCGAPAAPAAPRSPDRDREGGSAHYDWRPSVGTRGSPVGYMTCNSSTEGDSGHSTGGRRGASLMRSGANVMPSTSVANGHKGAQRHRDAPRGGRDTCNGDSGRQSILSSVSAEEKSSRVPLERLTQGRTGVVKLPRIEPPRREAWSIFPQGMDPRVRTERGEGHRFEAKPLTQDWCDACSCQITARALECQSK